MKITTKRQKEAMRAAVEKADASGLDLPGNHEPPHIDVDPRKMAAKPSEEEVKKFLTLSEADIEMLNRIASGNPPRNSQAILSAIKMKLDATVAKPTQQVQANHKGDFTVIVESLDKFGETP